MCPFVVTYLWMRSLLVTPPPIARSIVMSVSVCLSVCLSAIISSELHVRSSRMFLRMLSTAVARSFSGGVLVRCVLPGLWMTSYLHISRGCSTIFGSRLRGKIVKMPGKTLLHAQQTTSSCYLPDTDSAQSRYTVISVLPLVHVGHVHVQLTTLAFGAQPRDDR